METPTNVTIKGILGSLMASLDEENKKRVISLGMGDPTAYSCFTTTDVVQDSVVQTLESQKFNGYAPTIGLPQTRNCRNSNSYDVYITAGCTQAIEVTISILAKPNAKMLVPKPEFPIYELCAAFRNVEIRHYDLLSEKGWEVDLNAIDELVDENTVAIMIINPRIPCGNVYSYQHLKKAAVPRILSDTKKVFFTRTIGILKQSSDLCFKKLKEIPCLTCPQKPQGAINRLHSEEALDRSSRFTDVISITEGSDDCYR
ncbi:probable aminotransferase TAT2 [Tanacetum coccineum]